MNILEKRKAMIEVAKEATDYKLGESGFEIAREIAKSVINGELHKVFVTGSTRRERKLLIGAAFNLVRNEPLKCMIFKRKNTEKCKNCLRTCCYNEILQDRFAEEMFPNDKVD